MKNYFGILCFFTSFYIFSQNVDTSSQLYSPQQLIENILIDSDCISNVVVTNTVSGNFNSSEKSYGYFDANGSTFPMTTGVVLSTGKLSNVEGPNSTLSDDDGENWFGDSDLEQALNESNTLNATILEFEFTSEVYEISFNYLFASEEYQEGNPNTCNYSDLFGFLIRPIGETQFENIALIPGTNTPVKVTTVHPEIPNACQAENEFYFDTFNNTSAPINFNGQTKVLTAKANTVPGTRYIVKLVIADEQNYRYDSAVFLEAGSFKASKDLGPNKLISTNNPACDGETIILDATTPNATSYKWFKNDVELTNETNETLTVINSGIYNVMIELDTSCIIEGTINIEYSNNPIVNNTSLVACDDNHDGYTSFNLWNAENEITTTADQNIIGFYKDFNLTEPISSPENFYNTELNQVVYALVSNTYGCTSSAEIQLNISNTILNISPLSECDNEISDGFTTFNLTSIVDDISSSIPINANVTFYTNEDDALLEINSLPLLYTNTSPYSETLFIKVTTENNNCFSLSTVDLIVLNKPEVGLDYDKYYCLNNFPNTILLEGEIISQENSATYQWFYNSTEININSSTIDINEAGIYTFRVTNPNGCFSEQTITVNEVISPIISEVLISQESTLNTVTIITQNSGDFQYAINAPSLIYQDSNTFNTISPGFYTVSVRDKNGCNVTTKDIAILGFPNFFTPNNDGYNDYWKPIGSNSEFNPNLNIKIFNRYGKLLKLINPLGKGWDGNYKNQPLPSDDYWYLITQDNQKTFTGHFTLKR